MHRPVRWFIMGNHLFVLLGKVLSPGAFRTIDQGNDWRMAVGRIKRLLAVAGTVGSLGFFGGPIPAQADPVRGPVTEQGPTGSADGVAPPAPGAPEPAEAGGPPAIADSVVLGSGAYMLSQRAHQTALEDGDDDQTEWEAETFVAMLMTRLRVFNSRGAGVSVLRFDEALG